jgi:hypothetical protein
MSSMDLTKDDFWTRYGTKQRTLLRPYHFKQLVNTKSSSLMRQITQPTTFNSFYGLILRRFITTVGLFSPATTKTKLSNRYNQGVQYLTSTSQVKTSRKLQHNSSSVSGLYLRSRVSNMIQRLLQK